MQKLYVLEGVKTPVTCPMAYPCPYTIIGDISVITFELVAYFSIQQVGEILKALESGGVMVPTSEEVQKNLGVYLLLVKHFHSTMN